MKNWLRVLILCCVCVLISLTLVACQTTVNAFQSNESQKGTTVQDPIDNENTLPQEPNAPEVIEPIDNMNDSYWFVTGKPKAYVIYFETSNGKNGTYMAYSAETNEDKTFKCVTQTKHSYNGTFEIIQNNGTYNIKFFDKWFDESDSQGDYAKYTLTYSANNETFTLNGSFMNVNSTWIFVGYGLL